MKNFTFFTFLLSALFCLSNSSTVAQWANGQAAQYVIGQPDFSTYTSGTATNQLSSPQGVAIDYTNGKLYVADHDNMRVLRFAYPITTNQPTPERVFGITGNSTAAQNTTPLASSVAVSNGTLYVAQDNKNRITKFNNAYSAASDAPNADGVLGQSDYSTVTSGITQSKLQNPTDIFIDSNGNLWVADYYNHRVLKFATVSGKSNGANADLVLGQSNFTSSSTGTSLSSLWYPKGVTVNGTTVWVADENNQRVLRYDNPTLDGASASGVLGVTSTSGVSSTNFNNPGYVAIDAAGRLYVSDNNNGRVMIFNGAANKSNSAAADNVLGQSDFTTLTGTNGGQSGFYYSNPSHSVNNVAVDATNGKLIVTDGTNHRIMIFASSSALPVELTSFNVNVVNGTVSLNWNTATEKNNYGFEIEKVNRHQAVGNSDWEKVGFVQGGGNSNSPKEYSFTDNTATSGKYAYRLKQIDNDGKYEYSGIVEADFGQPNKFELKQNYPNPFNPSTKITYTLPFDSKVILTLYNTIGQEIKVLEEANKEAGSYSINFDAACLNSGVYIYKLAAGSYVHTRKMILAK